MSTPTVSATSSPFSNTRIVRFLTWLSNDNGSDLILDPETGEFFYKDINDVKYNISIVDGSTCTFTMQPITVSFQDFMESELPSPIEDLGWNYDVDEFRCQDYENIEDATDVVQYVAQSLTNISDEERARLIAMLVNKQ
jgi:hypothetical protein